MMKGNEDKLTKRKFLFLSVALKTFALTFWLPELILDSIVVKSLTC